MSLVELQIQHLRNIQSASFVPSLKFNVLFGENGSGKTSILEAIHYLSLGRSFRSHIHSRVVTYGADNLVVYGKLREGSTLGVEKHHSGKTRIRINTDKQTSVSELAQLLPIQLINPDTYKLLEGNSKLRRNFLDWGVFHVEHCFLSLWQRSQQIIKQRNAALKLHSRLEDIKIWESELVSIAENMDRIRKDYIDVYLPVFNETLGKLIDCGVTLRYFRGWHSEQSYAEVLSRSLDRDRVLGYTQYGPHRADLKLLVQQIPVIDVLSRGQQKLLVYAMRIAQGKLLNHLTHKRCIYLVDDLLAELDKIKSALLLKEFSELDAQVFITSVSKEAFETMDDCVISSKLFHVEQGKVNELVDM